jgi:heme exporter protein CcmB
MKPTPFFFWEYAALKSQRFLWVLAIAFYGLLTTLLYWITGEAQQVPALYGLLSLFIIFTLFLLSDYLFHEDLERGVFDFVMLENESLAAILLSKFFFFWGVIGVPLSILTPFFASIHAPPHDPILTIFLFIWLSALYAALCVMGSAITVGARRQKGLLFFLILPLYVPIFLISTQLFAALGAGDTILPYIEMLAGMSFLYLPLSLIAGVYGLRIAIME